MAIIKYEREGSEVTPKTPNYSRCLCSVCGEEIDDGYGECEVCGRLFCAKHNELVDGVCPDCREEAAGYIPF